MPEVIAWYLSSNLINAERYGIEFLRQEDDLITFELDAFLQGLRPQLLKPQNEKYDCRIDCGDVQKKSTKQ